MALFEAHENKEKMSTEHSLEGKRKSKPNGCDKVAFLLSHNEMDLELPRRKENNGNRSSLLLSNSWAFWGTLLSRYVIRISL